MKIISGIITSMLLALGLLVAATPAQADPYPHSVVTNCSAYPTKGTFGRNEVVRVRFRVSTNGGGEPNSLVSVRVRNVKTGKLVVNTTRRYQAGREKWKLGKLPKGSYFVRYVANPNNDRYKNCNVRHRVRVR